MTAKEDPISKIYFGKYQPEKKIGEGSFGKIYSSFNIQTKEKYAIKFVKTVIIIQEIKNTGQSLLECEAYLLSYLKGRNLK